MRIGLPSALVAPYYRTLWKTFFAELGHEPVESVATNKSILDAGVRNAVPEICVPIKIFIGHYLKLIESGVDAVYVPRFVSIREWDTFCPKFLGLPDMLRHAFPEHESKVLTHIIRSKSEDIATLSNFLPLARRLGAKRFEAVRAIDAARRKWLEFRRLTFRA
jgi:predicted nucleotide-binding protein (sugar kinase/HSP70/actin superfamily)